MGVVALKWQGWLVALVFVAGLLVFAPLGLYVWAGGAPAARPAGSARDDVRISGCRIDPASRRVVASVEAVNRFPGPGAYVVTVEFRDHPTRDLDGGQASGSARAAASGSAGAPASGPDQVSPPTPERAAASGSAGTPDRAPGAAADRVADPVVAPAAGVSGSAAPAVMGPQVLVRIPGVRAGAAEHADVLGPVWPPATVPWCGIAAADFTLAP
ncbi:hypothetical protein OTB20_06815 [Streptomyces sp. H27-H1]|uniref:hypothetical protein n=1 Tax=Streptomyces sp. H27-H1 TaxID=2996461 RepID=UPI002271DD1C|nr:hypothetical protein [Streptomyces sp. H27-H1]MCY0925921.1 hypothetical protein [Streptomyces sp. H27-H1]